VVKHIISLLQALNLQISLNQALSLKREVSEPQVLKWRGVRDLNPLKISVLFIIMYVFREALRP